MAKVTKKELQSAFDTILRFVGERKALNPAEIMETSVVMKALLILAENEPDEQA